MELFEQIIEIYPELSINDFKPGGSIVLQDDSDGNGSYIKEWNHPTLSKPELGGI